MGILRTNLFDKGSDFRQPSLSVVGKYSPVVIVGVEQYQLIVFPRTAAQVLYGPGKEGGNQQRKQYRQRYHPK
jgi:hypothetical protein